MLSNDLVERERRRKRGSKHRKRYYFSDESVASDTVIAFVMAGIALALELATVICSVKTAGHVPEICGLLILISVILSVVGEVFAQLAKKSQKGSLGSKRASALLCIVPFAVAIAFLILSR